MQIGASPIGATPIGAGPSEVVGVVVSMMLPAATELRMRGNYRVPGELRREGEAGFQVKVASLRGEGLVEQLVMEGMLVQAGPGWALSGESLRRMDGRERGPAEAGSGMRLWVQVVQEGLIRVELPAWGPLEGLGSLVESGRLPVEWAGVVLVQAVGRLLAERLGSVQSRTKVPGSALRRELRAGGVSGESLRAAGVDGQLPGEARLRLRRLAQAPGELLAGTQGVLKAPIEWGGQIIFETKGAFPVSTIQMMEASPYDMSAEWQLGASESLRMPQGSMRALVSVGGFGGDSLLEMSGIEAGLLQDLLLSAGLPAELAADILQGNRALVVMPVEAEGQLQFRIGVTRSIRDGGQSWTIE